MRFLTADYLFPLNTDPIKEGVIQIDEDGYIQSMFLNRDIKFKEQLEIYEGILCPGFVNTHCHLELSHLRGVSNSSKNFFDFLNIIKKRNASSKEIILNSIEIAEKEMIKNGIVAVGDVCNTTDTILQKKKNNLHYYNFIEGYEIKEENIYRKIKEIKSIRDLFRKEDLKATIVPHSFYSVTPRLMNEISNSLDSYDSALSIHNQEISSENNLFDSNSGELYNWLKSINASSEIWINQNKNKLFTSHNINYILVHNTFLRKEDLKEHYYCTCPKANLFIEGKLPDYSLFNIDKLCVGTDSLASNNSLSILEELKIISRNTSYDLNTLLKIGAKNGANALNLKQFGTFEIGKQPGINLLNTTDGILKNDTNVKVLV